MKVLVLALLAALAVAALAATAQASRTDFRGDPRKCPFHKPAQCARDSARTALRVYLGKRAGTTYIYQGATDCQQALPSSLLRWRCTFGSAATSGTATVRFWGTPDGWKRQVTILTG